MDYEVSEHFVSNVNKKKSGYYGAIQVPIEPSVSRPEPVNELKVRSPPVKRNLVLFSAPLGIIPEKVL